MADLATVFGVSFFVWLASTCIIIMLCDYAPHFDEREDLEE